MLSPAGTAVENLNSLLRHTKISQNNPVPSVKKQTTPLASQSSLLKKMSKGASKLLANKDNNNMLQMSSDHLINLHNSAEQLVQTSSSNSMLPGGK